MIYFCFYINIYTNSQQFLISKNAIKRWKHSSLKLLKFKTDCKTSSERDSEKNYGELVVAGAGVLLFVFRSALILLCCISRSWWMTRNSPKPAPRPKPALRAEVSGSLARSTVIEAVSPDCPILLFPTQRPELVVEHRVPEGQAEQAWPFLYMDLPGIFPTKRNDKWLI